MVLKKSYKEKIMVSDLIENKDYSIVACKVNHRMRELSYFVSKDCEIEFLGLDDEESTKIYEASLRFSFAMASAKLFSKFKH